MQTCSFPRFWIICITTLPLTCSSACEVYFEVILYFLEDGRENSGQDEVNKTKLHMFLVATRKLDMESRARKFQGFLFVYFIKGKLNYVIEKISEKMHAVYSNIY